MDRKSEFIRLASQFLALKYEFRAINLAERIQEDHEHICSMLKDVLNPFVNFVDNQQQTEGKKEIRYIMISSLFSSAITRSYEYQIAFCNEDWYLDPIESCFYWTPNFIFNEIDKDIEEFAFSIRNKIPGPKNYELNEIRKLYIEQIHILSGLFFENVFPLALEGSGFRRLAIADQVDIYFGIYMDRSVQIAQIKRDDD